MKKETKTAAESTSSPRTVATRERILGVAETLFAERGIDGVSLREITTAAGANSAAAHYHFGTKEELLDALFTPRAVQIANRRMELLAMVRKDRKGRLNLEDVLRAFLRPGLEVTDTPDGETFIRLRARLALEPTELRRAVLSRAFDQSSKAFITALQEALPESKPTDVIWRFHFILGAMLYTMAAPGRVESITGGSVNTSDTREAVEQLVRFAAMGLKAP